MSSAKVNASENTLQLELLITVSLRPMRTFHAIPAADENEAADILVQQEGYPHAADTPAEGEAEKVSHTYSYTPLHHQPYEGYLQLGKWPYR